MTTYLFASLIPFVREPAIALLPAVAFLAGAIATRPAKFPGMWFAGISWVMFAINEFQLLLRYPAGDPVIRIDLLLVGPLIWIATLVGIISGIRALIPGNRGFVAVDTNPTDTNEARSKSVS